jgi:hypothetical protein
MALEVQGCNMEVERKWILKKEYEKEFDDTVTDIVNVYYLSIDPEVRIRATHCKDGKKYYELTIKGDGPLERVEVNRELTEQEFLDLVPLRKFSCEKIATKDFHGFEANRVTCKNRPILYYVEKEFASEKEAVKFLPSEICGEEVTNLKEYKMKYYVGKENSLSYDGGSF